MELVVNILFFVQFCACKDIYNWNVKTIERDSGLAKDLEEQSNFNYEQGKDFSQILDKINNDNLFYKKLKNKYAWNPNYINIDKNVVFDEATSYPFSEKVFAKNENGKYDIMESFVGTSLFDSTIKRFFSTNTIKRFFSTEDVALLATRRSFENLIPKDLPKRLFSDRMVQELLNYFYIRRQKIIETTADDLMQLTLKAFYDTLGGYLNYYMVPVAKYSYYAGQISLNTAKQVLILYKQCKTILNTNGLGWKPPIQNVLIEMESIQIEPLNIPPLNGDKFDKPSFCMHLDMANDEYTSLDDKMMVQIPKLNAEDLNSYLGNVWLPFSRKKIYDLKADSSAYIIVKFYETVTNCYRYENIDQSYYNSQFKSWLLESIHTHLSDEQFYPGLGDVLRIYEYLKRTKKDTKTNKENKNVYNIKSAEDSNKFYNTKILKNNAKVFKDSGVLQIKETNQKPNDIEKTSSGTVNQKPFEAAIDGPELTAANNIESTNIKIKLRNIVKTPSQIAIIVIPIVAIVLLIIVCCYKSFCKKKKSEVPIKENSSSSSSNLFNSPVRFFHVSDYSSNEAGGKKNLKNKKNLP